MPHVSFRVSEQEKELMDNYAKMHEVNLSDAIKAAFFEKLEDEFDLEMIRKHEEEKAQGKVKYYTHDEVKKLLGL